MAQENVKKCFQQLLLGLILTGLLGCQSTDTPSDTDLRLESITDLLGYYTYAHPDTSYILYVEQQGPYLWAKLFFQQGPMPADKVLQRTLPKFNTTAYQLMELDLAEQQFTSPFGDGNLHWKQDSMALHFESFRGLNGKVAFSLMR